MDVRSSYTQWPTCRRIPTSHLMSVGPSSLTFPVPSTTWTMGMFEEVRAHIPSMAAWIRAAMGPKLSYPQQLWSPVRRSPRPLGFTQLNLHLIVKKIKEEVPSLRINAWYLDDGTLPETSQKL